MQQTHDFIKRMPGQQNTALEK